MKKKDQSSDGEQKWNKTQKTTSLSFNMHGLWLKQMLRIAGTNKRTRACIKGKGKKNLRFSGPPIWELNKSITVLQKVYLHQKPKLKGIMRMKICKLATYRSGMEIQSEEQWGCETNLELE